MTAGIISFLSAMIGSLLLDATVRPRRNAPREWPGLLIHLLALSVAFGVFLAGSGHGPVAGLLALALVALLTVMSNAKHAMLGEPLVFSDLALIAALVRHPRFYFTAISALQRCALMVGGSALILALAFLFVSRPEPHLVGLGVSLVSALALAVLLHSRLVRTLAPAPALDADVMRHGLIATLLLYWLRWRDTPDPPTLAKGRAQRKGAGAPPPRPELIMIVQCESFADPVELTGEIEYQLGGLSAARDSAWQWGNLEVSGFGAYTMRTEYGVLFGRSEEQLGFRRYDPFLTAHGETSYALSTQLTAQGFHCLFVHPHDMRFYGRDRLMPAMGFDRLIGEESFDPIPSDGGRYMNDRLLGESLSRLADAASGPTMIYAVTMENHGPWAKDRLTGQPGGLNAYLRHLRSSDTMLTNLIDRMSDARKPALLVFFGDHRPSIPGVTEPGGPRHTPYIMLRFARDGRIVEGADRRVDLSPDMLHHAILSAVSADEGC